jgi:DNA-3-methyladenine glycosylase II
MASLGDKPDYWNRAKKELSIKDKKIEKVIEEFNNLQLVSKGDIFQTLIRSIVGQQISVKAAATIWGRLIEEVETITPESILLKEPARLRNCGLSERKEEYIRGIANSWSDYSKYKWENMSDEEIIEKLTMLRGVGRWTAEMILIFTLLRPDVFPIKDIGMIRGIEKTYNSGKEMRIEDIMKVSEKWRPWRTVACCFMWRAIDPKPVEY